jgi:hypothetical protein
LDSGVLKMVFKNFIELEYYVNDFIDKHRNLEGKDLDDFAANTYAQAEISNENKANLKNLLSAHFSESNYSGYIKISPDISLINKYLNYEDQLGRLLFIFRNYHPLKVNPGFIKMVSTCADKFKFQNHISNLSFILNFIMFNHKYNLHLENDLRISKDGIEKSDDHKNFTEFYKKITAGDERIENNVSEIIIRYKYPTKKKSKQPDELILKSSIVKMQMVLDLKTAIEKSEKLEKRFAYPESNKKEIKNQISYFKYRSAHGVFSFFKENNLIENHSDNSLLKLIGELFQQIGLIPESYPPYQLAGYLKAWVSAAKKIK